MLKLVTFSAAKGLSHVGAVLNNKNVVHLHAVDASFPDDMLTLIERGPDALRHAKEIVAIAPLSAIHGYPYYTLLAPIVPTRNVFCVGKNYKEHVGEVQFVKEDVASTEPAEAPTSPVFFTKAPECVVPHFTHIDAHAGLSKHLDYEVELAVIIGTGGRDIAVDQAIHHVFGYTCANDVSARDVQRKHLQWFKGKSLDRSCPLGPCIVPHAELPLSAVGPNGQPNLALQLWLNGALKQNSRTNRMIFSVPQIISSLSEGFTLKPGDVILTGTCEGVGYAQKPPRCLLPGDFVKIEIENIGVLENDVR